MSNLDPSPASVVACKDMGGKPAPGVEEPWAPVIGTDRLGRAFTDDERQYFDKALRAHDFTGARRYALLFARRLARSNAGAQAGEAEIERVLSMSPEEVDRELESYGFDLAAEDAKAEKFLHDLAHGFVDASDGAPDPVAAPSPEQRPASGVVSAAKPARRAGPERRRRPPAAVVLLAAVTAGAVAGGAIYAARHHGQSPTPPGPQPPGPAPSPSSTAPGPLQTVPPDLVAAAEWRKKAFAACDDGRWSDCLENLDQARALDPAGDSSPLAKSARERAIRGMQQKPEKPPVPRNPQNPDEQPLK